MSVPEAAHAEPQAARTVAFARGDRSVTGRVREKRVRGDCLLLDHWDEIARRVRAARQIQLFLDFDGTLVGFRSSPELVILKDSMRTALQGVAQHKRVRVAIVSGRRRASLLQFIENPKIQLYGLYGWESPAGCPRVPPRISAKLARARKMLEKWPQQLPGIRIEDKELSLAIHFRGAPLQSERRAQARLRAMVGKLGPELKLIRADTTWELGPRLIRGKDAAVKAVLGAVRAPYLPVYVGDDWTDEPAFALLRRGITALVGPPRRTHAEFRLTDTRDVCTFLERLEAELH